MNSDNKNTFDRWPVIAAAIAISSLGALFYNVMPMYVGSAQDAWQLSNQQTGFIGTAFFLGYNLVTISAFFWIRKWDWRRVAGIAIPIGAIGLLMGTTTEDYNLLLLSVCIAGGGFSAVYGIGTTVIADTSNPTRWYGLKIAAEAAPGIFLLSLLPGTLIASYGFAGITYGILIAICLLVPWLFALPSQGLSELNTISDDEINASINQGSRSAVIAALLATFLFFTAASAVWTFIERLGNASGFSADDVGVLLAVTLIMATSGSLMAAWLGERLGNVKPFIAGSIVFIVGTIWLGQLGGFASYAFASCVVNLAFGFVIPFAIGEVAKLDVDGRFIILSVPAVGMGAMFGPGLAGVLADQFGFSTLLFAASVGALIAIAMMVYSSRFESKRAAS